MHQRLLSLEAVEALPQGTILDRNSCDSDQKVHEGLSAVPEYLNITSSICYSWGFHVSWDTRIALPQGSTIPQEGADMHPIASIAPVLQSYANVCFESDRIEYL